MEQTAVEWLIEKHFGGIDNCTPDFRYHINKAKEMEKQQIIDAYSSAEDNCEWLIEEHRYQRFYSEQYYKQTYEI